MHGALGRARLREVLPRDHTQRETGGAHRVAIGQEPVLLGAVAPSMPARGHRVITDEALERDLPAPCLGGEGTTPADEGERPGGPMAGDACGDAEGRAR